MELTFNDTFEIIPEWNDNKKEDKPVSVDCRYLTTPERADVFESKNVVTTGQYRIETVIHKEKLLKLSIKNIENLIVNKEGIKTAGQLVKHPGLSALAEELANRLYTKNITGDLKNL